MNCYKCGKILEVEDGKPKPKLKLKLAALVVGFLLL